MTQDAPPSVYSGNMINEQSFAVSAGVLARPERSLYWRILKHFIEGALSPLDSPHADAVARLIEVDLVQADSDGRIAVAYPFSSRPTRHRVTLHDGRSYHAVCAIDALGIPYMLSERGEIHSQEPDAGLIIRVTVDPDCEPTWTPEQAVAVAASGDGDCLAQSACPHINLFASPEAAKSYLDIHALQGSILSIPDGARAGRWLFGDLMRSLADAEAP